MKLSLISQPPPPGDCLFVDFSQAVLLLEFTYTVSIVAFPGCTQIEQKYKDL